MYRRPIIVLLTLSAGACAELGRGDTPGEPPRSAAGWRPAEIVGPALSFAAGGVHDLLVATCTAGGCHGSGAGGYTVSGDVDADYAQALSKVVPGDALASKLIKKVSNTSSHGGGPILESGSAGYELLVEWINDGAFP